MSGSVGASRTVQARLEQGSLLSSFRETSSISLAFLTQVLPIYPLPPQLHPPSQVGDSVHSLTWRSHDTLEATISSLPSSSLGPVLLSTLLDGKVVASARLLPQNSKYSPTPVSSFFTPLPSPRPMLRVSKESEVEVTLHSPVKLEGGHGRQEGREQSPGEE